MFDGHDGRHSVSDICPCEIRILFFQDSEFPRILVHHHRKGGFKPCQMRAAFRIINVITKSKHILVKFIDILECNFHFDSFRGSFEIYRFMNDFILLIQITDKSKDSVWLMIFDMLRLRHSSVFKQNRKRRIQICRLVESALNLVRFEPGLFKNRVVRKEIDRCSRLLRLPNHRKKPVHKFNCRDSSLIVVMMNRSAAANLDIHISGKRIYNRRTDTMKSTACLICGIIEFTARM